MDLFVVIVNWNARDDTIRCVHQVQGWDGISSRVWVVDNASGNNEADAIAEACPGAAVVPSAENLGFAGGTNLGLRHAAAGSRAVVLLLNNDVMLGSETVETLLETLESQPECGIVGPVICHGSDPERVLTAGNRSPVLHRNHALTEPLDPRDPYPVVFVSGAVALIRARVLEEVGLLDERYFFGLELADLCRRARLKGHHTLVTPGVRAAHHVERSTALRESLYLYYVVRNRFLYLRKFHPFSGPLLSMIWALYGFQQSWRLEKRGRRPTARAIRMGVCDGIRGLYGGQNERVLSFCSDPGQARKD